MENALTRRAALVGHLELTVPAIAGILLVPFFGLRMFGPSLFLYYLLAGIALAWQWYSVARPSWKKWLVGKGVPQEEADDLAHRAGLAWPAGMAGIGFFALHTTAAAICGIHFGPWLLSRWYAWIKPLSGMSSHAPTGNDWLQNFELTSIVPALVVGYLLSRSRYSPRLATYAWVLPTAVLGYKLLTFTEPQASVLAPQASMRWEYFFVIQRTMPTFFAGGDPVRVAEQINVVAPFYAGLAYSTGAIAETHDLVKRFFGNSRMQPETETAEMEENAERRVVSEHEKPVQELD